MKRKQVVLSVVLLVTSATSQAFAVDTMNTRFWRNRSHDQAQETDQKVLMLVDAQPNEIEKDSMTSFASSLGVNSGNSAGTFRPTLDFQGSFPIGQKGNGEAQIRLSIKGEPASGDAKEVAQTIRLDTGTISFNFGANYGTFIKGTNGNMAWDIKPALQVSYQRASSASGVASGSANTSKSDFGILTSELNAYLWMKYALAGYKFSYSNTFGNKTEVSNEVNDSAVHKILLQAKVDALSNGESKSAPNPFVVEMSYTSNKNTFSDGTFLITMTKDFDFRPSKK